MYVCVWWWWCYLVIYVCTLPGDHGEKVHAVMSMSYLVCSSRHEIGDMDREGKVCLFLCWYDLGIGPAGVM